jgi:hypothetical protein
MKKLDKAYKAIVEKSFDIKKIEHGFSFRTTDNRPCELTIEPRLEIHKGEVLLSAWYGLKVSGYFYTYSQSRGDNFKEELAQFAHMYEILRNRQGVRVEDERHLMCNFVDSLRK